MNSEGNNDSARVRMKLAVGALAIIALAFAVYSPILPGSFLMDDARLTGASNPLVNGQLTPWSLWFQTDFTLATFGWWLEHLAFGTNPAGYHVVNIALHAISALLLWRLLARLRIPGAWLAAALFTVHPVCVNSVARIAELKNTLSLPFFIFSFIAYLRYESAALSPTDSRERKATLWHIVSLLAFVLALLAKTTAVMLPVVLLLCAAWQRSRIALKDIIHTAPFFVLSLAFGVMSMWFQKNQALPSTELPLPPMSFPERLAAAGYDFWFYLGKAVLPVHLSIQYTRWTINPHSVVAYLPIILACAIFIVCWQFRRVWGRHGLFGLGVFAVILFPALGFFDAQFLTMWQVSDHLQYMALPAVVALAAAALAAWLPGAAFRPVAIAPLLVGSILCLQRAQAFSTQQDLMEATIRENPQLPDAHNDLGIVFVKQGDYARAMRQFAIAVKCDSNNVDARVNLGHALTMGGKFADAESQYAAALRIRPLAPLTHKMYANLLKLQGRNADALYHLRMAVLFEPDAETYMDLASLEYATGDSQRAVNDFRRALAAGPGPNEAMVLNNLAWILATCPDDSVRNGADAVRFAERACRMTNFKKPGMVGTLAAAYAEAGRFPDAIATAESAIKLATDEGNKQFAAVNQKMLLLYQAGKPYREKRPGN